MLHNPLIFLLDNDMGRIFAVKLSILDIIEKESKTLTKNPKQKPLSDQDIANLLNNNGYQGASGGLVKQLRKECGISPPCTSRTTSKNIRHEGRKTLYKQGNWQEILKHIAKARGELLGQQAACITTSSNNQLGYAWFSSSLTGPSKV